MGTGGPMRKTKDSGAIYFRFGKSIVKLRVINQATQMTVIEFADGTRVTIHRNALIKIKPKKEGLFLWQLQKL